MDRPFVNAGHALVRVVVATGFFALMWCLPVVPAAARAQVVAPKTLPVLQGGQFEMHPSARAGMGGAVIAVDDSLLDPFVNPAKTARMGAGNVFISPYLHNVSGGRGGGRTIPIGGGGQWGAWSATGLFTFQQLDRAGPTWNLPTADQSAFNQYVSGSIARRISSRTAVGFGVQLAALDAVDGVDLLYGGSDRIDQSGSSSDFRVGLTRETGVDRNLELMLVHSRTDMRHDVRFTTWSWNPIEGREIIRQRNEVNEDKTNIWGLHSEYSRPVGSEGWKLGWLGTVNRLDHPKIPNYVIQNIPRDPGTTWSFNAGMGIGRSIRGTSFAAELIYEPMFSETWADAAGDTATANGGIIRAGAKTVENTFRFRNSRLRVGAGHDLTVGRRNTVVGLQAGLGVHAVNYRLRQTNNVLETFRTQDEDWIEWTPTVGLRVRTRDLDLLYNFSITCGPGACGGTVIMPFVSFPDRLETASGGGIIAAPSSELFMQSGALTVHKLTLSLPIR